MGKDVEATVESSNFKLRCMRAWRNMDPSELRLKVLGDCEQHEHSYLKRACSGTSVRELAVCIKISRTTVHRVLQVKTSHPFHVMRVQLLQPDNNSGCVAFAQHL